MEKQTKFFTTNNLLLILVSSIVSIIGTLGVLQGVPILVSETELGRRLNQLEVIPKEPVVSEKLVEARDIPDMVEQVSDAVVSVIATADVPVVEQYFEEYNPWGDFFGRGFGFSIPRQRQIGTEKQEVGGGSGFFVSADGFIITNRHVVDASNVEYSVVTNDGETYPVQVVAKDTALDIAVLKIESDTSFPFLTFGDSEEVRLGSTAIAIGNALAQFPNSVSVGVISGLSRDIVAGDSAGSLESLEGVIQTDAAINRGNSGGPLLNARGEVIGVNVAVAGNGENIGFALPASSVAQVFESVKNTGEIVRPYIGVRYVQIDEVIAKKNNLKYEHGVLIVRGESRTDLAVMPGSPADKAGLVENDIILEIDGKKLTGSPSFAGVIREYGVGDTITLKVLHDGSEKEIKVTLEKVPAW